MCQLCDHHCALVRVRAWLALPHLLPHHTTTNQHNVTCPRGEIYHQIILPQNISHIVSLLPLLVVLFIWKINAEKSSFWRKENSVHVSLLFLCVCVCAQRKVIDLLLCVRFKKVDLLLVWLDLFPIACFICTQCISLYVCWLCPLRLNQKSISEADFLASPNIAIVIIIEFTFSFVCNGLL